jgi:LPS-assembly lipoprotein
VKAPALAAVALVTGALLGACGFHLQGVSRLPPAFATTRLVAEDRYTSFHGALVDALHAAGVQLTTSAADATATVEVLADDSGQRVLSVSALNTPTEYEVYYTVRYRVRIGDKEVLSPKVLTLTKDYSFNEAAVLAKEAEQQQIRVALARELAVIVMRRLTALTP